MCTASTGAQTLFPHFYNLQKRYRSLYADHDGQSGIDRMRNDPVHPERAGPRLGAPELRLQLLQLDCPWSSGVHFRTDLFQVRNRMQSGLSGTVQYR